MTPPAGRLLEVQKSGSWGSNGPRTLITGKEPLWKCRLAPIMAQPLEPEGLDSPNPKLPSDGAVGVYKVRPSLGQFSPVSSSIALLQLQDAKEKVVTAVT